MDVSGSPSFSVLQTAEQRVLQCEIELARAHKEVAEREQEVSDGIVCSELREWALWMCVREYRMLTGVYEQ